MESLPDAVLQRFVYTPLEKTLLVETAALGAHLDAVVSGYSSECSAAAALDRALQALRPHSGGVAAAGEPLVRQLLAGARGRGAVLLRRLPPLLLQAREMRTQLLQFEAVNGSVALELRACEGDGARHVAQAKRVLSEAQGTLARRLGCAIGECEVASGEGGRTMFELRAMRRRLPRRELQGGGGGGGAVAPEKRAAGGGGGEAGRAKLPRPVDGALAPFPLICSPVGGRGQPASAQTTRTPLGTAGSIQSTGSTTASCSTGTS